MSQHPPRQRQQGQSGQMQVQQTGGQQLSNQQFAGQQMGGQAMGGQQMYSSSYLFDTRKTVSEEARARIIEELNLVLADTVVLESQVRFAHWNVKGMNFVGLHELFDDIAEVLEDQIDVIGERITALGGQALGTAGRAVRNTRIPHMSHDCVLGQEFLGVLVDHLSMHDAYLYQAIQLANQYGDFDTADTLNEISREITQNLWFLEAHFQTQPVSEIQVSGGQRGRSGGQQTGGQAMGGQQAWTGGGQGTGTAGQYQQPPSQ